MFRLLTVGATMFALALPVATGAESNRTHHHQQTHHSCNTYTINQYKQFVRHHYRGGKIVKRWEHRLHQIERCMLNGPNARHYAIEWRRGYAYGQADPCSNSNVIACIREAAAKYGQPLGDMLRVARCESGFSPTENYQGHIGVFQFLYPGTWNTTPYARYSVTSAKYNSLAAAWMWKNGRRNEWQCQ